MGLELKKRMEQTEKKQRVYTKPMGSFVKDYWAYVKRSKEVGADYLSMMDYAAKKKEQVKAE